jgi:preprotein translocase subunit SecF
MEKVLVFLRGLVRPSLTWLFAIPFIGVAIYAFVRFGTPEMALGIVTAFVAVVSLIVGVYFQSRNQAKPPEK